LKKINTFFFALLYTLSFSQGDSKIIVKQQDIIFFYRTGEFPDSLITKNVSDTFFVKLSDDKKINTEIKLKNATFIKTNDKHLYKLSYTPGMNYRFIYQSESTETPNQKNKQKTIIYTPKIEPDGANTDASKKIIIDLWDTKSNKKLLTNTFTYKEK